MILTEKQSLVYDQFLSIGLTSIDLEKQENIRNIIGYNKVSFGLIIKSLSDKGLLHKQGQNLVLGKNVDVTIEDIKKNDIKKDLPKRIKSVCLSQEEIISDIIHLHVPQGFIDVDPTYSKGNFYKNGVIRQPSHKFDLNPQVDGCIKASSVDIPLDDNSVECIMFDPPFLITGSTYNDNVEGSSIIAKRFSGYKNFMELKEHYVGTLKEAKRILKTNGILIFKCQNTVSSGKQHFSHFFILNWAIKLGMYPKDEFILENKFKMTSFSDNKKGSVGNWKKQQHALKHHSYFLVIQNRECKVNYEL